MNDDLDWEAEFEEEWAKIEQAVPDIALDPSKVGDQAIRATLVHPLAAEILERTKAGERFRVRLMEPDTEAIEAGDLVPVQVQVYLSESERGGFISVVTTNAGSFAAEPDQQTEQADLSYAPDLVEVDPEAEYDPGKLYALVQHVLDHAEPKDRAFALEHPGLNLRPRDDGMIEVVVAADGRVLGAFDRALLEP